MLLLLLLLSPASSWMKFIMGVSGCSSLTWLVPTAVTEQQVHVRTWPVVQGFVVENFGPGDEVFVC